MKERYYFDKMNGIIAVLGLIFLILPITVILLFLSIEIFWREIEILISGDVNLAYKFLAVLFMLLPLFIIIVSAWFVKLFGKEAYLCLHSIEVDDEGITCSFFHNIKKFLSWDDVEECGIGWDFDRIQRNNKTLPDGKEKFVIDREKYKNINGVKYIFFSTKRITETEKMEIFSGQLKKEYLIAVKYTTQLSEYLQSTDRYKKKDREIYERFCERENMQDRFLKIDDNIRLKQFAEKKMGITSLIVCFIWLFWTAVFMMESAIAALFPLVFVVVSGRKVRQFLQVVTVDGEGVESKIIFGRERRWRWDDIKECGVIRNNSPRRGDGGTINQRYIFFSIKPFCLEKDKLFLKQFKRKDVILVTYSERLYCYLHELGVIEDS